MATIRRKTCISLLFLMFVLLFGLLGGGCAPVKSAISKMAGQTSETQDENTVPTATAEETAPTADATTQPQQIVIEDQPAVLTMLLEQNGSTYEELAQRKCSQLVCVVADGTFATIRFFACDNGVWQEDTQLFCEGYVGRSGVATDKKEGDGNTPCGLYGIGDAFYIDDAPKTALHTFQITADTYWVDDPDSKFYNQRVEGLEHKDWDSAEHMIDYAAYRYGFVVEYNPAAEYGAGSAIFFHIGENPTAGCIATQKEMVKGYLAELDAERKPCILIVQESKA